MAFAARTNGYSLYELVMTLGLVALLTAIGVPSFAGLAADKYLRTEVNALFLLIPLLYSREQHLSCLKWVYVCFFISPFFFLNLPRSPLSGWASERHATLL